MLIPNSYIFYIHPCSLDSKPPKQPVLLWYPEDSDILDVAFPITNAISPTMVLTFFSFASAQVSKSLLNAGLISVIMSEVVVERPYFWKA